MAKCEHLEGVACEVFTRNAIIPTKCGLPNGLGFPCPIAVSQTGDRSFAQAFAEYCDVIDPNQHNSQ